MYCNYKLLNDSKKQFYYVYRIINIVENKHYYGSRTAEHANPKELGTFPFRNKPGESYFSSSSCKIFMLDQELYLERFKYKLVSVHDTIKEALKKEQRLHKKCRVGINSLFYNKIEAPSEYFSISGNEKIFKRIC